MKTLTLQILPISSEWAGSTLVEKVADIDEAHDVIHKVVRQAFKERDIFMLKEFWHNQVAYLLDGDGQEIFSYTPEHYVLTEIKDIVSHSDEVRCAVTTNAPEHTWPRPLPLEA